MNSHSFIRQTVERSDREEHARRVKKPVLPPGPQGTEGSRALAAVRRVTEQGGMGPTSRKGSPQRAEEMARDFVQQMFREMGMASQDVRDYVEEALKDVYGDQYRAREEVSLRR